MWLTVPVLCAQSQPSHQDVCDEGHSRNVKVWSVYIKAGGDRGVLLVAHLPILQNRHIPHNNQVYNLHIFPQIIYGFI